VYVHESLFYFIIIRVKELAASDPSERRDNGVMDTMNDVDMESSHRQENDLAQLRSLNVNHFYDIFVWMCYK